MNNPERLGNRALHPGMPDPSPAVDHPKHYNRHPSGIECIDVVEHMSFNLGNAVKYIWRADEKGAPLQDLEKARWYITREIEKRKLAADRTLIKSFLPDTKVS